MADEKVLNEEEMVEYDTFTYDLNGKVMEWAITDEFEFEGKKYIVCAEVLGDALSEEGLYLFEKVEDDGEEITVKNIDSEEDYDRAVDAYCVLEDAE